MKRCPKCDNIYTDDSLNFCLQDGERLIAGVHQRFDPNAETLKLSTAGSQSKTSGLRTMISIEIDENLTKVKGFAEAVSRRVNLTGSPIALAQRTSALQSEPLPSFDRRSWERTPTPDLAEALSPTEIERVHHFYSRLDELARLRNEKNKYSKRSEWRKAFEPILQALLERGNPLD